MTLILPQKCFWSNSLGPPTFDMTAGDDSSEIGYKASDGVGTISNEPLAGETLSGCYDRYVLSNDFRLIFDGDVTALLSEYTEVYIDGSLAYSGGSFDLVSGETVFRIDGSNPSLYGFSDGSTYSIEIR